MCHSILSPEDMTQADKHNLLHQRITRVNICLLDQGKYILSHYSMSLVDKISSHSQIHPTFGLVGRSDHYKPSCWKATLILKDINIILLKG